jgi:putative transposase
MLTALLVLLRSIGLICRGHRSVALENLALRQRLAVLTRTVAHPRLRRRDRLCWILLVKGWREWRTTLMVVQPETGAAVASRKWLRRRWPDRSRRIRPGRPITAATIRSLVDEMAVANSLWEAPRIHGELRKVGIEIPEQTVSRMLQRRRGAHPLRHGERSWPITASLVATDFFTVPLRGTSPRQSNS